MIKLLPTDINRKPFGSWEDGAIPFSELAMEKYENLGAIIPEGYVVLDFDSMDRAKKFDEVLKYKNIETLSYNTTKGKHYWFKYRGRLATQAALNNALGLICELKVGGRNAMVHIKHNNIKRIDKIDLDLVDELPYWAITKKIDIKDFTGLGDGSGRYMKLFDSLVDWLKWGLTVDQIKEVVDIINNVLFAEPTDSTWKLFEGNEYITNFQKFFNEEGTNKVKLDMIKLVDFLISSYHMKYFEGNLWVWNENQYLPVFGRDLEAIYYKYWVNNSTAVRKEITNHLINRAENVVGNDTIQFKNGYLKNRVWYPEKPNPLNFTTYSIPYEVKEHPEQEEIYRYFFSSIADGDYDLSNYLKDIITYLLDVTNNEELTFVLEGGGRNGKSTYNLLIEKIFDSNAAKLNLGQITGGEFMLGNLLGKVINVSNDIDNKYIGSDGIFKQLISWETLVINRKGKEPIEATPKIKFIFSTNQLPMFNDKTNGVLRRLVVVPFTADFLKNPVKEYENIKELVTKKEFIEHVLFKCLSKISNYNITKSPSVVAEAIKKYRDANNNVYAWMHEMGEFYQAHQRVAYGDYLDWCGVTEQAMTSRQFTAAMSQMGYRLVQTSMINNNKKVNIRVFRNDDLKEVAPDLTKLDREIEQFRQSKGT